MLWLSGKLIDCFILRARSYFDVLFFLTFTMLCNVNRYQHFHTNHLLGYKNMYQIQTSNFTNISQNVSFFCLLNFKLFFMRCHKLWTFQIYFCVFLGVFDSVFSFSNRNNNFFDYLNFPHAWTSSDLSSSPRVHLMKAFNKV